MDKLIKAVEKNRDLILNSHEWLWKNPETGYKEVKTSKYLEDAYEKLGYEVIRAGDIPGFYVKIDTGRPGPEVMILGELDSLICPNHKDADPETGAVHCCGHSAQSAALLGIAAALKEPEVLDDLSGKIRLCAVPAEELIEIEYRKELMKEGRIKYFGGKAEFLYRGYFDGVDIAFMVHTNSDFCTLAGSVGCMAKKISYKGVSAHAGGNPWEGCNALYAANQGLSAINAIRETFQERDLIRVHPIITHGGEVVNAIPELVTIESYIRGLSFEAIKEANEKVNRALCGGALALGANIEIEDMPGYTPHINDKNMIELSKDAAEIALPELEYVVSDTYTTGCTDMGDLSAIMPIVHPYISGAEGKSHGEDYVIAAPETACVGSAKWQVTMLALLLENNAKRAEKIIKEFKPRFASKKEFFDCLDSINSSGERITYNDDGSVTVKVK